MGTITIHTGDRTQLFSFEKELLLSDLLKQSGILFSMPCAGKHTCGKCKVTAYGALSPLSQEEKSLLSMEEQLSNIRLACCTHILGPSTIYLPKTSDPLPEQQPPVSIIESGSSFGDARWSLAVDIGTTTVAVWLIDTCTGKTEAAGALNAQAAYGADVISRIENCQGEGLRLQQKAILGQLDSLFKSLLISKRVPKKALGGVVLTGNTTMLHLLSGLDPSGIAVAPYQPQSLFGVMESARGWFPSLPPALPVYLAPCISAFIGADTVCALLACKLGQNELLLDIGTNGEMAFCAGEELICCSTAAGPAFEGAGLQYGMLATEGAICKVASAEGRLYWETIGGTSAKGICGTGIISALATMLRIGAVDETGRLSEKYGDAFPIGESGIFVTQEDIRKLQLAKAAIAAGIDALLFAAGITPAFAGAVHLAGGFGTVIDPDEAVEIGLIPPEFSGRIRPAGNAAGTGARICAVSQQAVDEAEHIASSARLLDLSEDPYFNERYIEQMLFPILSL